MIAPVDRITIPICIGEIEIDKSLRLPHFPILILTIIFMYKKLFERGFL
jgi:hypothetical protein